MVFRKSTSLLIYEQEKHRDSTLALQPTQHQEAEAHQTVLVLEDTKSMSIVGLIRYESKLRISGEMEIYDDSSWYICWICAVSGYGTDLLLKFEDLARTRQVKTLYLSCYASNGESEETVLTRFNFYQKHGYRFVGVQYETEQEEDGFLRIQTCFKRMKVL